MERPNHLKLEKKSAANKATSLAIVIAIHVAGIAGLVAALAQGALIKQLQEIKASVDMQKTPPKAPPPPDLVKPPPPVAIVPEFQVATAPPPPVTTVPKAPPAPPPPKAAPVAASDPLRPIQRTHTQPPYPPISQRLNESGTSLIEVHITVEGNVDTCKVVQTSSSERLDNAACEWVKGHWRWQPPTQQGTPHDVSTRISVKWDLKDVK
jgi:periplasmic protein TonB